MNKSIFYILFFISFLFTSCIPTQDLIYLQDKGNTAKEGVKQVPQKPYRLQTNDVISVKIKALDSNLVAIFANSDSSTQSPNADVMYFQGYVVDDHGNIRIPILGEINVLGFTIEEVRKKIEEQLLAEYFKKEAEIFVDVRFAGFKYTINGEVTLTGTKVLYQERVNILEAIANAGDITVTGDRKDVKVIRQFSHGTETFSIDLTDANALQSPVYNLQPNDYIYVKPMKQKTWGTGKTGIESLGTIISILTLATTTFLLLNR